MDRQSGFGSWFVDQEHRRWAMHRKIAGWLDTIQGLFALLALVYLLVARTDLSSDELAPVMVGCGLIVLLGAAGLGFVFDRRWSRFVLWPICTLLLLGFPIGTALGAYNLWVLYNTRAAATSAG